MNFSFGNLSAIRIWAVEISLYIVLDRGFERHERRIVARRAQTLHPCLGEILVTARELRGHVDIFDFRLSSERFHHRSHHVLETARLTSAGVIDAGYAWVFE